MRAEKKLQKMTHTQKKSAKIIKKAEICGSAEESHACIMQVFCIFFLSYKRKIKYIEKYK